MLSTVTRTLFVALVLWVSVPASVCQAICVAVVQAATDPPPCHGPASDGPAAERDHESDACPKCGEGTALLSTTSPQGSQAAAGGAPWLPASGVEIAEAAGGRLAPPQRAPPDLATTPYAQANRPLLS